MSIVDVFRDEFLSDDEDQSDRLQNLYEGADEAGKKLLDDALTCLCGYSLKTLIAKAEAEDEGEDEDEEAQG
jgi:hypothetical protein